VSFDITTDSIPGRRRFLRRTSAAALGAVGAWSDPSRASEVAGRGAAAGVSRLILLGTAGGPTPKPNRAAPAQVLVVNGASYVVDCGNGVASQLIKAKVPLLSIRSIFVTHHHSDHDADWGNLHLLAWASDLEKPIASYGPPDLEKMKKAFLELNAVDIAIRMADEGRPALDRLMQVHDITKGGPVMQDDNVKVTCAVVDHPPIPALAFRFDCPDRSIVMSGDTRVSRNLIELAKGADVLVHEVMHVPSIGSLIANEPNAKTLREHLLASHTSTEDVGKLATEAGVKTLVLSHFVPGGYPFLADEVWKGAVRPYFSGNLVVGRDLMEL
jgi:ribonuclease BN (tRNA processing enzyme)